MKTNDTYILSYVKGTLSDKEMKECDILVDSSSDFAEKVNQIMEIYHLFDNLEAQKKIDIESAWRKTDKKIKRDKTKKSIWNFTRNTAAILLPLFLLLQYVVQPLLTESSQQEIITLYSAPGVITKTLLPDGSEVWINAQSELSYPREFIGNDRTVKLMGEAYFKVLSDDKNRFNVITPDETVVSAFGTEFNVNAYSQDSEYTITLAKGSVDVLLSNLEEKKTLKPGQKAIVGQDTKALRISAADTYAETAWKDGKMVFRREDIKNIAEKISRKFGVAIQVEGDVTKDYQFTATFTDESLEDILELLKLSSSIDYSISKQQKLSNDTFSQKVVTLICK